LPTRTSQQGVSGSTHMILLAVALGLAFPLDRPNDRFSGGFIQLTSSMATAETRLSRRQWGDVLRSRKQAGMTTVVIQYLVFKEAAGDFDFMRPGAEDDATEWILSESEADDLKGMTISIPTRQHMRHRPKQPRSTNRSSMGRASIS